MEITIGLYWTFNTEPLNITGEGARVVGQVPAQTFGQLAPQSKSLRLRCFALGQL